MNAGFAILVLDSEAQLFGDHYNAAGGVLWENEIHNLDRYSPDFIVSAHDTCLVIISKLSHNEKAMLSAAQTSRGFVVSKRDKGDPEEPDWLDPAKTRKTPYTDEEIDRLVEDFILGLDDNEWSSMKSELGEEKTRARIRAEFVKLDEKNLSNFIPKGPIH